MLKDWYHGRQDRTYGGSMKIRDVGYEYCQPGRGFGPAVRDYHLIHLVVDGRGRFVRMGGGGSRSWDLEACSAFLIRPGELTYYEADVHKPWYYVWLGFESDDAEALLEAAGFGMEQPLAVLSRGQVQELAAAICRLASEKLDSHSGHLKELSLAYRLLSYLVENREAAESGSGSGHADAAPRQVVEAAVSYAHRHYLYGITVNDMASHAGVDRTHLFRLFKGVLGESPKQFLTRIRMERAKVLLMEPELAVKEIAASVGYRDPYLFSRMFKLYEGMPPMGYREKKGKA